MLGISKLARCFCVVRFSQRVGSRIHCFTTSEAAKYRLRRHVQRWRKDVFAWAAVSITLGFTMHQLPQGSFSDTIRLLLHILQKAKRIRRPL